MALTFEIPLLNPFRFVNLNAAIDPRYNSLPFDLENDINNPNGQYIQPWQLNDTAKIQVLSDYAPAIDDDNLNQQLSWDFYAHNGSNLIYLNVPLNAVPNNILGETFKAYEGEVDFSDFDSGVYYSEVSYIDENNDRQVWQTNLIRVAFKHDKTRLIQYKNSKNDKGVIFNTGIVFNIRIEGVRRNYTPKSQNQDYIDQNYNNYPLNDIPYRIFTFFIGTAKGLPDWLVDKMNIIFSLNSVRIDYDYYNKVSGKEFELTRPTGGVNEDAYMQIDIMPNDNINLSIFDTGDLPTGDLVVIRKTLPYKNNAADITIPGVFTTYTNLVAIAIINKGLNAFTMKIGTTAPVAGVGSSDIATLNVTADEASYELINNYFKVAKTVYITGLAGTNCDIYIVYDQLDAPVIDTPPSTSKFAKGTLYFYYEVAEGDFETHFNVDTGAGQPGTDYEGCVLVNILEDISNHVIGVWDKDLPATRQTSIGSDELTIEKANIPNDLNPIIRGANGPKPAFGGGVSGIWVTYDPSTNVNIGNPIKMDPLNNDPQQPMQNIPLTFLLPAFVKITD